MTRNTDPQSSADAAASINVENLLQQVHQCLIQHGPLTTEEISTKTGLRLQTVTPRMVQLERKNWAARTDERRPGASNRRRIVWRAA